MKTGADQLAIPFSADLFHPTLRLPALTPHPTETTAMARPHPVAEPTHHIVPPPGSLPRHRARTLPRRTSADRGVASPPSPPPPAWTLPRTRDRWTRHASRRMKRGPKSCESKWMKRWPGKGRCFFTKVGTSRVCPTKSVLASELGRDWDWNGCPSCCEWSLWTGPRVWMEECEPNRPAHVLSPKPRRHLKMH